MKKTSAQRQAAFTKRQKDAGLIKFQMWIPAALKDQAKRLIEDLLKKS